jgi:hypothetical protein
MLLEVFCLDDVATQRRISRKRKVAFIVPVRVAARAVLHLAVGGIRAANRRPSSLRPWTASRAPAPLESGTSARMTRISYVGILLRFATTRRPEPSSRSPKHRTPPSFTAPSACSRHSPMPTYICGCSTPGMPGASHVVNRAPYGSQPSNFGPLTRPQSLPMPTLQWHEPTAL